MYGQSNVMTANDLEWGWRSLLLFQTFVILIIETPLAVIHYENLLTFFTLTSNFSSNTNLSYKVTAIFKNLKNNSTQTSPPITASDCHAIFYMTCDWSSWQTSCMEQWRIQRVSRVSGHPPFWLGCPFYEKNMFKHVINAVTASINILENA